MENWKLHGKDKNEEGLLDAQTLILSCRGDLTRTDDPLHPMQVR